MQIAIFILVLLLVVALSGVAVRLVRVPLPLIQIALGVALAWPVGGIHIRVDPDLFLLIFIPPLLLGDAYSAPKREMRKLVVPILSLAVGLVFFTIFAFGHALHWVVPGVPLAVAFALAAVLSPTDAVAVSSIIDKSAVPPRLMHMLEGEALLNDASGLVMFNFSVAAVLTGSFSLAEASASFVYAVVMGIACGLAVLLAITGAVRLIERIGGIAPEIQVLAMCLLPFAAYLLAESVEASGVLAAVMAGLLIGTVGTFGHMVASARIKIISLWSMLSFIFNGVVFVLLGLQLPAIIRRVPPEIGGGGSVAVPVLTVLVLTLCLIGLRFAWLAAGDFLSSARARVRGGASQALGFRARLAGAVAGVRGAVTLAAILSLPATLDDGSPFPAHDLVIFIAAGVILCSLALASLALPLIARGLAEEGEEGEALEERRAWVAAANAAIACVEAEADKGEESQSAARSAAADTVIAGYRARIAALDEAEDAGAEARAIAALEAGMRLSAIEAERQALRGMLARGEIDDGTFSRLSRQMTLSEALLHDRKLRAAAR